MEILKKLKNNQRGSVTVFVLATMLIVVGILVVAFFYSVNKTTAQMEELNKIQQEYNQTSNDSAMDQAYDKDIK